MSLSKNSFDKAKKRASERLTGWISDAKKQSPEFGIPRLQKEFKHAFKKIEFKPTSVPRSLEEVSTNKEQENETSKRDNDIKLLETVLQESLGDKNKKSAAVFPTLYLEDHNIHDSNSSNLSSRLECHSREIKFSDRRTPFVKTPFSQDEGLEDENAKNDPVPPTYQRQRRQSILVAPGIPMQFKQRKKKRKSKKDMDTFQENFHDELPSVDVQFDAVDPDAVAPMQTGALADDHDTLLIHTAASAMKRSSSMLSRTKSVLRPNRGGPLDLVMKRTVKRRQAVSKMELPVVKQEQYQTSEERRQVILGKFRRMVTLLIHVRVLLNVSRLRMEEEEKSKDFKRYDGGHELSFDSSMFKTAIAYGGLTPRARKCLKKNPNDRNEEDAKVLMEVMIRLPVFAKYPKSVKKDLACKMWYDCFKNGRIILKQGDPGSRMYFVVSGEVDLQRTDIMASGEENSYHIRTITAGSTFGELALMRDMRREFTAVCKGNSELLSLSKGEFNQVLRSSWERECNTRFTFLRSCEHFATWNDRQLQRFADSSELRSYTDNQVIMGDMDGLTDSVFFIRKGRCNIVRRILVVRHQSPYIRPNILLPNIAKTRSEFLNKSYCRSRRINREEIRFLTVSTLTTGNYFGAGENLRDTFILARGKAQCLVINSAQFSIQGKSELLRTLKRERDDAIPSNQALYARFQVNRKWHEYRNKLCQEVLNRKTAKSCGSYADVPRSIRMEPTIPLDLIYYNKIAKKH